MAASTSLSQAQARSTGDNLILLPRPFNPRGSGPEIKLYERETASAFKSAFRFKATIFLLTGFYILAAVCAGWFSTHKWVYVWTYLVFLPVACYGWYALKTGRHDHFFRFFVVIAAINLIAAFGTAVGFNQLYRADCENRDERLTRDDVFCDSDEYEYLIVRITLYILMCVTHSIALYTSMDCVLNTRKGSRNMKLPLSAQQ